MHKMNISFRILSGSMKKLRTSIFEAQWWQVAVGHGNPRGVEMRLIGFQSEVMYALSFKESGLGYNGLCSLIIIAHVAFKKPTLFPLCMDCRVLIPSSLRLQQTNSMNTTKLSTVADVNSPESLQQAMKQCQNRKTSSTVSVGDMVR